MTPSEMLKSKSSPQMSKHQQRYQRKKQAHIMLLRSKKENEEKNIRLMKEVSECEYYVKFLQQVIQTHHTQPARCALTNPEMDSSADLLHIRSDEGIASSTLSIDQSCGIPFLNNVNAQVSESVKDKDSPHEHPSHTGAISIPVSYYSGFRNNACQQHDSSCTQHLNFSTNFQNFNQEDSIDITNWNIQVPFDVDPSIDPQDDIFSKISFKDLPFSSNSYINGVEDLKGAFESFDYEPTLDLLHFNEATFVNR